MEISDGIEENTETISTNATILPALTSARQSIAYVPTTRNLATRGNLIAIPYLGDEFDHDGQRIINSISRETKSQVFHRTRSMFFCLYFSISLTYL
mgnify:CR=1 FL=1